MSFCGNCGTQIPEGATVCPNCGQPVEGAAPAQTANIPEQKPVQPQPAPTPAQQTGQAQQPNPAAQQNPYQSNPNPGLQQNPYQSSQNPGVQQNNPQQGQYYQQQGPSQASQTLNHMGANMNRLVPKTKSEGLEVACFIMSALSMKFSLSMFGQTFNIIGLILGAISVILLLINKEKTSNKTVQTLALIMGIAGIVLSILGIILVAADVPAKVMYNYIANKLQNALSDLY